MSAYSRAKQSLKSIIRKEGVEVRIKGVEYRGILNEVPSTRELVRGGWSEKITSELVIDADSLPRLDADKLVDEFVKFYDVRHAGKSLYLKEVQSDEVATHLGLIGQNKPQPSRPS